jgi:hypothetical protein
VSIIDGFGMGFGFTISLMVLGAIRELIGNGTIFNISVFGDGYLPLLLMILPPGAFIVLGLLLGLMNKAEISMAEKRGRQPIIRKEHDCANCAIHTKWFDFSTKEEPASDQG